MILKNCEIFNSFFADKSVLPSQLTLLTENSLANFHLSKKDNLQIIRTPDSNKTHGHDMISIRIRNVTLGSVNINFNGFQIFDA